MIEFFKVLSTSVASRARTLLAQLRGFGSEGDDNNAEPIDDAEVVYPVGFASRPYVSANTEAVGVRIGDEVVVLAIIDKGSGRDQLATIEAGEARLYSPKEPACVIRCKADGSIEITSKAGTNIVLNGGNLEVARRTDPTSGHTHGPGAYVAGIYAVTGTSASATDTIASGAQRVRA